MEISARDGNVGKAKMALTITRIPERYRAGLALINKISPAMVSAIVDAISKAPVVSRRDLIAIVELASGLKTEDAEEIVRSLRSLYIFKASAELSVDEFIPVIITAMQAVGTQALIVSDDNKPILTTKLKSLLGLNNLERAAKIEQLKADHQIIFYDAKIITDLRPIFDQPKDPPIGAVVTHTLKIICHESGEHKELYFALDANDVITLKKIADRASDKMSSLQALLKAANIPDLS